MEVVIFMTENYEINAEKQKKMFVEIYMLERKNLKTENLKDKDIRKKIEEIIEREADKCI